MSRGSSILLPKTDDDVYYERILRGDLLKQEITALKTLFPAQTSMGLSSYLVWYYGNGFLGRAKYPLLLYGLTLAAHTATHLTDLNDPNLVLAHRASCATGTFICMVAFSGVSKLASLLMLPAFGIYGWLTHITIKGINVETNGNVGGNENNNKEDFKRLTEVWRSDNENDTDYEGCETTFDLRHKCNERTRRRRTKKSILKERKDPQTKQHHRKSNASYKDYHSMDSKASKSGVSFQDVIEFRPSSPSTASSLSSISLNN